MKGKGWRTIAGHRYMRLRIGKGLRESVPLSGCTSDADANERAEAIRSMAKSLAKAGHADRVKDIAMQLGAAQSEKEIRGILRGAETLGGSATGAAAGEETFESFATLWTSGELHRQYPDHVSKKRTKADDASTLKLWVFPRVGGVPIRLFSLDDAEKVMRSLPRSLSAARRRHVAQVMHRVLSLAVFPARRRQASPLPEGFLPRLGPRKAKSFLYPDEDAKLMACREVPIEHRLVYGILDREGMRPSELLGGNDHGRKVAPLTWGELDLERGTVRLDANKTDDPRAWVLSPGVVAALKAWKTMTRPANDSGPVVSPPMPKDEKGKTKRSNAHAELLRVHLRTAGVRRAELFEDTDRRIAFRRHDLRGTFVTLALANGQTETWVADRTGHKSSTMINEYRQPARTAQELHLGDLLPLDQAIPEIRESGATRNLNATRKSGARGGASKGVVSGASRRRK